VVLYLDTLSAYNKLLHLISLFISLDMYVSPLR